MSENHIPAPRRVASRRARVVVWLLAALVVATSFLSSAETPVLPAGQGATSMSMFLAAEDGSSGSSIPTPSAEVTQGPRECDVQANYDSCFWRYAGEPTKLLPAWRWRDDVGLFQNTSITDFFGLPAMMSFIASFFFTLAGLLWWILLAISEWVFTAEVLVSSWRTINNGFAAIASVVWSQGVFLLGASIAVIVAMKYAVKFKFVKAIGALLTFALPMAAILVLAQGASAESTTANGLSRPHPASPAGLAIEGSQLVNTAVASAGTGFGFLSGTGSNLVAANPPSEPSCSAYIAAMYDQYYAYSSPATQEHYQEAIDTATGVRGSRVVSVPGGWLVPDWLTVKIATDQSAAGAADMGNFDYAAARENSRATDSLREDAATPVATISMLWERAFLSSWMQAQFGSVENGQRAYCHLLENNAGVSRTEQVTLADVANQYSAGAGYDGINPFVFGKRDGNKVTEQRMFAWMACVRDPGGVDGWRAEPGWAALGAGHGLTNENCADYFDAERYQALLEAGAMDQSNLSKAAGFFGKAFGLIPGSGALVSATTDYDSVGDMLEQEVQKRQEGSDTNDSTGNVTKLRFDTDDDLFQAVIESNTTEYASSSAALAACGSNGEGGEQGDCGVKSVLEVQDSVMSFWGHNSTQRVSHGAMALATSLIYLYALGMLALGAMIAKFGLVLMLALLPITLFALALPSARRSAMHGTSPGMKLLKMTGGFFLANVVLGLFMTLLIGTILILEGLFNSGDGAILSAAAPLVALFLLKRLFEQMGFGNITSAGGAIGMPLALAAAASGDKNWKNQAKGAFSNPNSRLGKALGKGDALAKGSAKRAAMMPVAGGKWAAKKAGKGVSDRYALGERKKQLLGAKDKNGKLTELGLAQRLGSLAGMIDMAKNGKHTGKLAERMLASKAGGKFNAFARSGIFLDAVAKSNAAADQMAQRRRMIEATKGKTGEERQKARRKVVEDLTQGSLENMRCLRDASGNAVLDASGNKVFGFKGTTPDGKTLMFESEAAALAASCDPASITAVTDVSEVVTPEALLLHTRKMMDFYGLREGQVVVSPEGFDGVPALVMSGTNGGIPISKNPAMGVVMADNFRTMLLSDQDKKIVNSLSGQPVALSHALAALEAHLGGVDEQGRRVSLFAQMGIDPNSELAQAEVQKKMNGQPSVFDQYPQQVAPEVLQAIISEAKQAQSTFDKKLVTKVAAEERPLMLEADELIEEMALGDVELKREQQNLTAVKRQYEVAKQGAAVVVSTETLDLATAARDAAAPDLTAAITAAQAELKEKNTAVSVARLKHGSPSVADLAAASAAEAEVAKLEALKKSLDAAVSSAQEEYKAKAAALQAAQVAEQSLLAELTEASGRVRGVMMEQSERQSRAETITVSLQTLDNMRLGLMGKKDLSVVIEQVDDWQRNQQAVIAARVLDLENDLKGLDAATFGGADAAALGQQIQQMVKSFSQGMRNTERKLNEQKGKQPGSVLDTMSAESRDFVVKMSPVKGTVPWK